MSIRKRERERERERKTDFRKHKRHKNQSPFKILRKSINRKLNAYLT